MGISVILICIILVLFHFSGQTAKVEETIPQNPSGNIAFDSDHKVIVYYFHGKYRCYSCNLIEHLTIQSIEEGFSDELAKGSVSVKALDVQEPGNKHFIKDYSLYTKSVIVSDVRSGKEIRWKNLTKVWELLRNEVAFKSYVQAEVNKFLESVES